MSEPSSPDIVADLDAELALIEQLPYRVPIHALAQRARDEIVALRRDREALSDNRNLWLLARAEERERCVRVAAGFGGPVADGIAAALRAENIGESEERTTDE